MCQWRTIGRTAYCQQDAPAGGYPKIACEFRRISVSSPSGSVDNFEQETEAVSKKRTRYLSMRAGMSMLTKIWRRMMKSLLRHVSSTNITMNCECIRSKWAKEELTLEVSVEKNFGRTNYAINRRKLVALFVLEQLNNESEIFL